MIKGSAEVATRITITRHISKEGRVLMALPFFYDFLPQ
jgi:hypothetical protein